MPRAHRLALAITFLTAPGLGAIAAPPPPATPAATQPQAGDVAATCRTYEAQIKEMASAGKVADAVQASARYEQALRAAQQPPAARQGHFRDAARGVTCDVPFAADWKAPTPADMQLWKQASMAGADLLLMLNGGEKDDHLLLMTYDQEALLRRMGGVDAPSEAAQRGQMRLMAERFGTVATERTDRRGGSEFWRAHLQADRQTEFAGILHDGVVYYFMLSTAGDAKPGPLASNMDRWLDSVKFDAADAQRAARVAAIRARVPKEPALAPLLTSVRELAEAGELREATLQLSDVRSALVGMMPRPQVDAHKGLAFEAYGLLLKNPDGDRWKPSVQPQGAMYMLMLEDTASVTPAAIAVATMDPILLYGPGVMDDELRPNNDGDDARNLLSSIGRGGLNNMGNGIDGERFRKFHGLLAYEGTTTAKIPNTRAKVIVARGSRAIYMMMIFGPPTALADDEKLLDANLTLRDAPTTAPSK